MAKQTSYSYQKKVLENFSSLLEKLAIELDSVSSQYEKDIHSMYEDHGLMEEIYTDYQVGYIGSVKESLLELTSKIREEHIPFVEREIDFISSR